MTTDIKLIRAVATDEAFKALCIQSKVDYEEVMAMNEGLSDDELKDLIEACEEGIVEKENNND